MAQIKAANNMEVIKEMQEMARNQAKQFTKFLKKDTLIQLVDHGALRNLGVSDIDY